MATLKETYFWVEFASTGGTISGLTNKYTDMYHSFDGSTWDTTPSTLSMGSNTLVYFRNDSKLMSKYDTTYNNLTYLNINFNKTAVVGGDLSSLTNMDSYCCYCLFSGNINLIDASQLILPWDSIGYYSCECMFQNCTRLITGPKILAMEMGESSCASMFSGCENLKNAPQLPATILGDYCYSNMFENCTKLETAPLLPAATLEIASYQRMFYRCTKLNYIKMLATNIKASGCLSDWVDNVASTGTFVKHPNTNFPMVDGIPEGWTVINNGDAGSEYPGEILSNNYFWVEFEETGGEVYFSDVNALVAGLNGTDIYYSFDCVSWNSPTSTDSVKKTIKLGNNTKVYIKNETHKMNNGTRGTGILFNKNAKIGGDLSTIVSMSEECCNGLFYRNKFLTDASELILPWNVVENRCFYDMFQECTNLVYPPQLPATILKGACYLAMFNNCKSLKTAPELPATILSTEERNNDGGDPADICGCYGGMFFGCTSLKEAPELPATTLAPGCYNSMFEDCQRLIKAPALPATTLEEDCYRFMFARCNLKELPLLHATQLAKGCYSYMFAYSSNITTAPELPATTLAPACYDGMFYDCTVLTTPPELPATTLANYCYRHMFEGCTILTTAPELPATILTTGCYDEMFRRCTNLTYIKMLATDISAEECLSMWVDDVAPTGTFVKAAANTSIPVDSSAGIPDGWTVYNEGDPNIPEPPTIPTEKNNDYFWVEFEDAKGTISGLNSRFSYSFDCVAWTTCSSSLSVGANTTVYFKNESKNIKYVSIKFSQNAKIGGDLSSIGEMTTGGFEDLFYSTNTKLTDASELILPWDNVYEEAFTYMFKGCAYLKYPPKLPATTLGKSAYESMFKDCTSLLYAPELPATVLGERCYAYMFDGCTSLNYIKMMATDITANMCLYAWVRDVAPTGTFVKAASNTDIPVDSDNGIPIGWTVYNEGDPNIPEPDIPTDPDNPNPPVDPDPDEPLEPEDGAIVSKTITIDNSAQDVEISVEQTNIALWTDVVIEEGDAYASLGTYDFTDSKITLEVNQNRSQTTRNIVIHIYAIDVNDNVVEGVITVVQDAYDEPIVPPEEITIPDIMLYKTRLDFPATGGSLSVQVDYRNATTINTPTCSQSWVSIRQSGGGGYYFEDDGSRVDQRMWIITMEETPFYRSAPIIFSCTNNVGTIFEEDKFMVYQTGPTTEDVEGDSYILVPKKEISLREIGESEEIIITYANVADIIAPEVPEGYEITEISRTQIDGNTIEVKYKITKIEDSKNDVKVIFKAQGTGGSEVKSDTTIKGWTPPTEPATVELPEIDLDNGVLVFEHTGGTRTIRLTIDGYTKPMNVDVTINDTNNNIHLVKNESDYDDGYDYCVWELDFESDGNTTNNPYEGTIDIHYTDGLTDKTISFPFYVRYEGEGLIKEFSNNFKFDKDGELLSMSDNIGVGYLNIMTYHIPTHPDWIIIGTPTDGGVSVSYDKVYRYPISVQPNEGAERTGIVRISGIGKDGKEYYTDVTVLQEGTNTEVIIDEGFIELQSLSVTLPAEGGSETFQVKYYDLQELLEPEFVGDWATIEKVSETSEDGVAWNGEECVVTTVTYKATAKATTYGRQAKVIFKSYINYGDGGRLYMEKDKFRVNQLAPNATGTMGTVFAFSNNITVDSRGFAAGDTIWKEARVGYKDVTIEYPVIDVDWFRIAKIVDKGSSKEYDALKYYELEFDKNLAAFSRTGTITFKGKNEDGTYTTAIVKVVQLGEEPVDPETGLAHNYKGYFKSLDCTLYSVSLITQPGYDSYEEIILAGDSPVVVSYTESDRLYVPLRTSTCTIKVMSSSYLMNLYTGKAQGTQVVVKNEDTGEIEWCGFLQPNLYNQGFSAPVETIEFEASDCLNTLQYIDYSDVYSNGRFVVTFKKIIDDIMDRCKLINSYYVTQKMYSDTFQSKTMDFVNFYISEYNFYSEEEEPWKLKEVLEEICKYMGYVCFQWGDSVYFMDYDMYKEKKMNGARWDKSTRWNTKNAVLISGKANEIVADSYMGTGASMSLDDVFNSVKVNCNYYNVDDLIPDLFEDDYLTNRHGENAVISISRYGGRGNSVLMNKTFYRVYDHKYINSLYYSPVTSTSAHETKVVPTEEQLKDRYFFREFIGGNIVDMVHLNYSEANEKVGESKDLERYLLISQLNRPWCGAEGTFHWEDYNFPIMEYKNIPVIFIDNTAEDETNRTATRATSSSRPNTRPQKKTPMPNYLVINASAAFVADLKAEYLSDTIEKGLGKKASQSWYTYGGSSIDQVRNTPALCFYLEIPQAGWWNGSTWVDYKTHFEVRLDRFTDGTDDNKKYYEHMFGIEKDVFNTVETYLFLGTTGYKIPLPKVMDTTRDMYFAIAMPKRFVHCSDSYGGDNTGKVGNAYCFIKDLEMKIVNRNTIFYENDEDEVYENVIDSAFVTEGEEIDLKITSDNYKRFSYSTVSTRTAEDVPTTDIQFYNKNMELRKPEEAIIERYVNQYSTPSIKTSLTLDMSFKPYELITDTYWKKDFVITGQEIDYKNASQTITLLEKK